jgi:hypothetical protein
MSKLSFSITANQATFVSHQVIGREGETATFLKRSLVNSKLREFGFAPRQLHHSASALEIETARKINEKPLYFSCAV